MTYSWIPLSRTLKGDKNVRVNRISISRTFLKKSEKVRLIKIMFSHLEMVDTNKINNHIPIKHIKEIKITSYIFYCFLKQSAIVICLMERLSSIWIKEDAFKAIAPTSPLSVNVEKLTSVSIAWCISFCVGYTAISSSSSLSSSSSSTVSFSRFGDGHLKAICSKLYQDLRKLHFSSSVFSP